MTVHWMKGVRGQVEGITCDGCSASYEPADSGELSEVLREARDAGFVAVQETERGQRVWRHYCRDCARKERMS